MIVIEDGKVTDILAFYKVDRNPVWLEEETIQGPDQPDYGSDGPLATQFLFYTRAESDPVLAMDVAFSVDEDEISLAMVTTIDEQYIDMLEYVMSVEMGVDIHESEYHEDLSAGMRETISKLSQMFDQMVERIEAGNLQPGEVVLYSELQG